jgi:hypothetical protein
MLLPRNLNSLYVPLYTLTNNKALPIKGKSGLLKKNMVYYSIITPFASRV